MRLRELLDLRQHRLVISIRGLTGGLSLSRGVFGVLHISLSLSRGVKPEIREGLCESPFLVRLRSSCEVFRKSLLGLGLKLTGSELRSLQGQHVLKKCFFRRG